MGQQQTGPIFHDEVNIMLTTSERQRLCSTMANEPISTIGVVLKCGICFAILLLIALIGSDGKEEEANSASIQALHMEWTTNMSSAAAHRKAVLDARRARLADSASVEASAK